MIERKVKTVRALERGLQVLSEIDRRRGANLHELHLALGLPKATLLRMVVTLGKHGHIWQRLADGAFLPSMRDGEPVGERSGAQIAEIASPHLARLSRSVAWPSALSAPRGDHMEILETNCSLLRLDAITMGPVGSRLSYLHTASGRAYLAACQEAERMRIIAQLRPSAPDPAGEAMLADLIATTQERGYALREPFHPWADRNWQAVRHDGRRSLAVPVMVEGRPIASINITWLHRRTETAIVVQRHLDGLRRASDAIARDVAARCVPA